MSRFLNTNTCAAVLAAGLLLAPRPAAAQVLTNNGATLAVQPGATLFVGGGLLNQAGGTLANAGTVALTGDFTLTAGTVSGAGLLRFVGSQDQTLSAPTNTTLARVEQASTGPAGANRLLVPNNLTVTDQLLLSNGLVRTAPTATLTLPNGATLAGEAAGRYVQGNLKALRSAVTGPVDFGIGVTLDGTGHNLGTVAVTRTAGLNVAGLSYGTNLGTTAQGIDRIWTVQPTTQPTAAVPLTLSWLADDDHGLTNFSQAQLWQQAAAGSGWGRVGAAGNGASRTLARSATALNRFTISNAANPLPVELVSFTAELRGADGLMRWTTASETNNDRFVVESSTDGTGFRRLGQVAGQGSTSQPHAYEYLDAHLARYAAPVVYYRLRQVDRDGTEAFSPVRTLALSALAGFAVEAFPNPLRSADQLNLRVRTAEAGPAALRVTDALGRTVLAEARELPAGSSTLALPAAAHWPLGVYLLHVQQAGQHQTVRVVRGD